MPCVSPLAHPGMPVAPKGWRTPGGGSLNSTMPTINVRSYELKRLAAGSDLKWSRTALTLSWMSAADASHTDS